MVASDAANGAGQPKFKVFLSYSRSDEAAADRMVGALEARGFNVRIDKRDLPYGEKWQKELAGFIKEADAVVFLVSPRSIGSQWCKWEVAQVAAQSKRLVPVVIETVPPAELPPEIGEVHLFPFTPGLDLASRADELARVLLTDRAWVQEHTRLAGLALTWAENRRSRDRLLRGQALAAAEQWMARRPEAAPPPSQEHLAFIAASQAAAKRRARLWSGGLAVIAALSLAGGLFSWQQKHLAEERLFESQKAHVATLLAEADIDLGRFALQSAAHKVLEGAKVESAYQRPVPDTRAEEALGRIAALNTYVTRFRSADYSDTLRFAFLDKETLAYTTGQEIFVADLAKQRLTQRFKLPDGMTAGQLKAIPEYDLLAVLDRDGKVGLFDKDGEAFHVAELGEKLIALDYSSVAELSLAVLSESALYFLDPGDSEGEPEKRPLPQGRGGDIYRRALAFDRSGEYLYWPDRSDPSTVSEYALGDGTLTDFQIRPADEPVPLARDTLVTNAAKDRAIIYCRPCGTLDPATAATAPLGHQLTFLGKPGEFLEINAYQADLAQMVLFAKNPQDAVTGVSAFAVQDDGSLRYPVRVYLEDETVKSHSLTECAAPEFPTGFLACRHLGAQDEGDGLIVWRLPEESESPTAAAAAADAVQAGQTILRSLQTWHALDAPFGK